MMRLLSMQRNFQAMLLGEMSVQSFLDNWAEQMNEAYAEYQAQ